jgi:hypothetical protein
VRVTPFDETPSPRPCAARKVARLGRRGAAGDRRGRRGRVSWFAARGGAGSLVQARSTARSAHVGRGSRRPRNNIVNSTLPTSTASAATRQSRATRSPGELRAQALAASNSYGRQRSGLAPVKAMCSQRSTGRRETSAPSAYGNLPPVCVTSRRRMVTEARGRLFTRPPGRTHHRAFASGRPPARPATSRCPRCCG